MSILLAVIVIAFVFTIGAAPGLTEKEKGLGDWDYYGVDLSPTSKQRRAVFERAEIQARMQMGQFLNNPEYARFAGQIISQTTQRNALENIPLLSIAEQIGLPSHSEKEGKAYIKEQSLFHTDSGRFSSEEYTKFQDMLAASGSEGQFVQTVEEAIIVDKLREALSSPGTALPFEAVAKVRHDKTQWSVGVAMLEPAATQEDAAAPTDAELSELYEETKDSYASVEKRKVSYIVFNSKHPNPTTAELKATYNRNPALYNPDIPVDVEEPAPEEKEDGDKEADDNEAKKEAPKYPAYDELPYEARRDVLDDYFAEKGILLEGLRGAAQEAEDLLNALYNDAHYLDRKDAEAELQKRGLVRHNYLQAYAEGAHPPKEQFLRNLNAPNFDFSPSDQDNKATDDLFTSAFSMSEDRFYSKDPINIGSKYVILWLESVDASQVPSFEELKKDAAELDKLTAQWRKRSEAKAFSTKREELEKALKASLAEGKGLEASVKAVGDLGKQWKLSYGSHLDFTGDKRPEGLPSQAFDSVKSLTQGKSSPMEAVEGKGYLLSVLEKKVPGYKATSLEVKNELSTLQRSGTNMTQELRDRGMAAMRVNQEAKETETEIN